MMAVSFNFTYIYIIFTFYQVYPVWKWFEKQDGIRSLQKNSKDPAPEFYNIYLERPKVLDAFRKEICYFNLILFVNLSTLWTSLIFISVTG